MELSEQNFLPEDCERPQHLGVDQWYVRHATGFSAEFGAELWCELKEHETNELKDRKARKRIEKWWDKASDPTYYNESPSNEKLAEAKRQQFTTEGKRERVTKSLAALSHPPYIRLTASEWREIVEDPDLEDQFS